MVAIASAALIGGLPTIALLWPQGALIALLCAPLGGSAAALTMAAVIAATRYAAETGQARRGAYAYSHATPHR